jgi:hypothetical protein
MLLTRHLSKRKLIANCSFFIDNKKVPLKRDTFLLRFFNYVLLLTEAVHFLALFSFQSNKAQKVLQDVAGKRKASERTPYLYASSTTSFTPLFFLISADTFGGTTS